MKRKPVINVHCHFFNFDFIPDRISKLLSNIPEDIADEKWVAVAAGFLASVIPGKKYDRIKEFLDLYRSDIDVVAGKYIKEMKKARIDICAPLMMDFKETVGKIEEGNIAYKQQIEMVSRQTAKYPWQIFPFVMFDPRRGDSFEICRDSIENKGFIGIKIYPALGYNPSPRGMAREGRPDAAENLRILYRYCGDNNIPITTHASTGGAYRTEADINREKNVWPYTEISNWLEPILEYDLKINFAHLGGNYLLSNDVKRVQSGTWRREILNFIARSKNEEGFGRIFTDLSYHDMALQKNQKKEYFDDLALLLSSDDTHRGFLFGTDASMISHTWTEKEYKRPFDRNLESAHREMIFSDNPTAFLFENAEIPRSYCQFIESHASPDNVASLKDWIRKDGNRYYIVTE